MAVKKNRNVLVERRTPDEITRDEIMIAQLYFKHVPLTKLPAELKKATEANYQLNTVTTSKILNQLLQKWKEEKVANIDARKNLELKKLDAIEAEYWEGWKRSLEPRVEVTESNSARDGMSTRTRTLERDGSPKFLEGVERCIWKRCTLLGLMDGLRIGLNGNPSDSYVDMDLSEIYKRLIVVVNNNQNNLTINNQEK